MLWSLAHSEKEENKYERTGNGGRHVWIVGIHGIHPWLWGGAACVVILLVIAAEISSSAVWCPPLLPYPRSPHFFSNFEQNKCEFRFWDLTLLRCRIWNGLPPSCQVKCVYLMSRWHLFPCTYSLEYQTKQVEVDLSKLPVSFIRVVAISSYNFRGQPRIQTSSSMRWDIWDKLWLPPRAGIPLVSLLPPPFPVLPTLRLPLTIPASSDTYGELPSFCGLLSLPLKRS